MSESLELPLAPIQRIVKAALPPGTTVAKEVKQSLGKAASLFILYLTSTANDVCKQHKRQTVSGEDVLAALEEIEFDMFLDPLQAYLAQYRDEVAKKRKPRVAPASDTGTGEGGQASAGKKRRAPSTKKDSAASASNSAAVAAAAPSSSDAPSPKRAKTAADAGPSSALAVSGGSSDVPSGAAADEHSNQVSDNEDAHDGHDEAADDDDDSN